MEVFGLMLAFPAVLIANLIYAFLAQMIFRRFVPLRNWLLWPSLFVLIVTLLDLICVATIGAVASRDSVGPTYWNLHLGAVVLGGPALANVLLTTDGERWYSRWCLVAAICFVFGIALVFFNVVVGDALFGPDDVGGPYGSSGA